MRRLSVEEGVAGLPLNNFGGMVIKISDCGDYIEVQEEYGDDNLSEIVEVPVEYFLYDELDEPNTDRDDFEDYYGIDGCAPGFYYEGEQFLVDEFMRL